MKPEHEAFISTWNKQSRAIHKTAVDKGWWHNYRHNGELIALIHSELSEALEGLRNHNPPDDKIPEFTSAEAELADAVIRIMDMGHARGWRIGEAIIAKSEMNKTRPTMHGGKAF